MYRFVSKSAILGLAEQMPERCIEGLEVMHVLSLFSQESVGSESVGIPFGSVVIDEGGAGDAFYMVRSGRLRVIKRAADGRSETTGFLYAGDHFGEGALLTGRGHRATVRAVEDSQVLKVPRDEFFRVLKKEPELEAYLQDQVANIAYRDFTRYLKGSVSGEAMSELFRRLTREEVTEGTTVSEPGGSRGRFCLLGSGELEMISKDGSALALVAGDFFEDADTLDGEPRRIRSQQDSVIYHLDRADLDSLIYSFPELVPLTEITRRLHTERVPDGSRSGETQPGAVQAGPADGKSPADSDGSPSSTRKAGTT